MTATEATAPARTDPPTIDKILDLVERIDRLHEKVTRSIEAQDEWARSHGHPEVER